MHLASGASRSFNSFCQLRHLRDNLVPSDGVAAKPRHRAKPERERWRAFVRQHAREPLRVLSERWRGMSTDEKNAYLCEVASLPQAQPPPLQLSAPPLPPDATPWHLGDVAWPVSSATLEAASVPHRASDMLNSSLGAQRCLWGATPLLSLGGHHS